MPLLTQGPARCQLSRRLFERPPLWERVLGLLFPSQEEGLSHVVLVPVLRGQNCLPSLLTVSTLPR